MSVVYAREVWPGRDATFENNVNNDLTRAWLVRTDNKLDTQLVVKDYFTTALGIQFLSPYPGNSFYTARRMEILQKDESPFGWDVTVDYSTRPFEQETEEGDFVNPLNRPTRITWSSEFVQKFTLRDKDGDPLVNSALFPFEPQEIDHVRWRITLRKNMNPVPEWVASYVNRVNTSSVTVGGLVLAARTLKANGLSISELQVQNDVPYYEVAIELSYDPDKWDLEILNQGFRDLGGTYITDDDGARVEEPWPLDANGDPLDTGWSEGDLTYEVYKVYKEADFNVLPF